MRQYLLIWLVALVAVGGCKRCDDDPKPQRSHKFDIYIEESFSTALQMAPYLTRDSTKRRVSTIYTVGAVRPNFTCSDQLWDIYEWHFGNGQVFTGKSISPYIDSYDLNDTVTLKVYSTDRKDSAKAGMRFQFKFISYWPHLGKYRGRLWYIDHYVENAEIEFDIGRNSTLSGAGVQARGLYKSACGVPDTIFFDFVGNNQIYQTGFGINDRGWLAPLDNIDACKFKNTFAYQSTGHYFTFKNDSISLLSVRWVRVISPGNEQFVTFKGKKL